MKATEQYFPVVLFIMLYTVALTLRLRKMFLRVVLPGEVVYYAVQKWSFFWDFSTFKIKFRTLLFFKFSL